jgi:transcriptional regulator with XRE-family HTH domain
LCMERLIEFIRAVMKQKGISVPEIAKRSGGTIKASYIFDILSGKTRHISVTKLNALAKGMDVDSVELFRAASGYATSPDAASELTAIFRIVLDMNAKQRAALLTQLRKKQN